MKNYLRSSLLLTIGLAGLSSFAAGAQETRWYVRADAGVALTQDTDLKEFFGPVAPGSKVKFDPGVRFSYGGGYRFTDWFAAEGQTGVMANSIRSMTGATVDNASLANVP